MRNSGKSIRMRKGQEACLPHSLWLAFCFRLLLLCVRSLAGHLREDLSAFFLPMCPGLCVSWALRENVP